VPEPAGDEFTRHNSERPRTYLWLAESAAPSALVVVNAVWPHILSRYSDVGMPSAYCDAGALLQTMYLVAADLGLPCTAAVARSVMLQRRERLRAFPASLLAPDTWCRSRNRAACSGFTANTR